jgi:hypothetical protein
MAAEKKRMDCPRFLNITPDQNACPDSTDLEKFTFAMKECEFRFNHRREEIYRLVLKMLRELPLS